MPYATTDKPTDEAEKDGALVGQTITLQNEDGTEFRAVVEKHDGREMVVCCVVTGTRFHMTKQTVQ